MTRLRNHAMDTPIWLLAMLLIAGCDERVVEVSRESAARQAEQNRTMAHLQQEVAAGARRLVEADAQAREDLIQVHAELIAEQSKLADERRVTDDERRHLAVERRRVSAWAPAIQAAGSALLAIVVIGFCWYVLVRLPSKTSSDGELVELLLAEITGQGTLSPRAGSFEAPSAVVDPRSALLAANQLNDKFSGDELS